jgi:putative PIN family toxin of toxin-antitoxin system
VTTVVLDTNVLASGFVRPEPPPGQILLAWRAALFTLVVSEHILSELARTFNEPYFRRHLTSDQRANNLALLRAEAVVVPITALVRGVATHQEDDLVLATAASASADYLITGDQKLRDVARFRRVAIRTPREFLELGIVQGHHGTITVKSASGAGTTFTISLPVQNSLLPTPVS